ncbi:MAG TPA: ATP-grasp domain-containing protein [Pyrinomonadaceae bacterium]|nr:ATP-grasp domain-containing protein [Pyrinomonadaceae bacterium]
MKIYVSGLYSGTNPQPGVGVARSLKAAYPEATLVGVEYSNRCSGIHWPDFDELWLQRPWEELNLEAYGEAVRDVLDSGAYWVSAIDLETMWLASLFPEGHPNLLSPGAAALRGVAKPAVPAHEGLPIRIPPYVWTEEHSDWDLHAFCRRYDWRVWLKGPYYEAVRAGSWAAFEGARTLMTRAWSTERLFLQAHVTGYEESVMLCAYRGELLGCVRMRKRDLTEEGKTWAGDVTEVSEEFSAPLRRIVRELNWSGGAEIEMVRDAAGQLWMIEWNPRFPAWVHGATIAGKNLPALLVEGATGVAPLRTEPRSDEFTRVVLEVPVRAEFPLPPLAEPLAGSFGGHSMKHPSGTLALANRLHKLNIGAGVAETNGANAEAVVVGAGGDADSAINGAAAGVGSLLRNGSGNGAAAVAGNGATVGNGGNGAGPRKSAANGNGRKAHAPAGAPRVPASFVEDLAGVDPAELQTPEWLFFEKTAAGMFERADKVARKLRSDGVEVTNAYSIKTNPDERLIRLARQNNFLAEAISLLEVEKAMKVGFPSEQVVLNGPGKWWPEGMMPRTPLHSLFCDSVADLRRVAAAMERKELRAKVVGVRLRTPHIPSRFGIPVDTPEVFERLIEAVGTLPGDCAFGVHFHMASSNVGVRQWWHLYESMLRWCGSLEKLTGRRVELLDVGGGWFPDDWMEDEGNRFSGAVAAARRHLPHVRQIVSEPGKAISQPTMAVAMRLLEIMDPEPDADEPTEAVVDGSIAELPMHFFQPHRILWHDRRSNEWRPLERGKTNLLGRLCMEHDFVAMNVRLPEEARAGDLLIFCDAGAYDRSMSYVFGRG